MSKVLSRSKRLAIAATTAAYAAAYIAAAWWLIDLSRALGAQGIDLVVMMLAIIVAPAAFPFWRSTLGPAGRLALFTGVIGGGLLGALLVLVASFVTLDPNLSSPSKSPTHVWAMALAALAGAMAGAFIATGETNRPPAPGSDRALRDEKAWAALQRKGRPRVLIEGFCYGFLWMPVMSLLDAVFRGRWAALRDQWAGPGVPANVVVMVLFGCWMAYIAGVRWNDMARRQGTPDEPPLTPQSA